MALQPEFRIENLSHHLMGTTRMHASARQGVVDADCRVHGVANLFVAGSSVFATGGYVNPTLTIVALAARLAHHLVGVLGAPPPLLAGAARAS
jgi:choline dehydrogenase-like flavoprotein